MKVNDRNLAAVDTGDAQATQGAQALSRESRNGAAGARNGSGSDRVELSALSRALESNSTSRSVRVAGLSAQYQAGQYQVDAVQVSRGMISDALQSSGSGLG